MATCVRSVICVRSLKFGKDSLKSKCVECIPSTFALTAEKKPVGKVARNVRNVPESNKLYDDQARSEIRQYVDRAEHCQPRDCLRADHKINTSVALLH